MSEEPRKPLWTWIATALIALPVLYVLSLGPWNWLVAHGWISQRLLVAIGVFYWPIDLITVHGPEPVRRAIMWYISFWS